MQYFLDDCVCRLLRVQVYVQDILSQNVCAGMYAENYVCRIFYSVVVAPCGVLAGASSLLKLIQVSYCCIELQLSHGIV